MKDTELFDDREFFVMPDEEDEPAVQSLPQNLPHPEALAHMHASHAPTPSEYSWYNQKMKSQLYLLLFFRLVKYPTKLQGVP